MQEEKDMLREQDAADQNGEESPVEIAHDLADDNLEAATTATAETTTRNGSNREVEVADTGEEVDDPDAGDQEVDPATMIELLQAELVAVRTDAESQKEQLQRLAAEFQNSKRRQEKQLADAIDRAGSRIIQQILPILDDYDLAFNNMPDDLGDENAAWVDGFRQIQRKLLALLDDQGVIPIASDGEFDPTLHEAVTSEPNDDVESGHIIQTLRVGYEHKGRVLRPALVRVAA